MKPRIGPFYFSVKKIVLTGVVVAPMVYLHSYRSRVKFMRKVREEELNSQMQLLNAQEVVEEMDVDQRFQDVFENFRMVSLRELEGSYKLIYLGELSLFMRFMRELGELSSKHDIVLYYIMNQNDEEMVQKLVKERQKYPRLRILNKVSRQSGRTNQLFLLDEEFKVLMHQDINVDDHRLVRMIQLKINKQIDQQFLTKLKF